MRKATKLDPRDAQVSLVYIILKPDLSKGVDTCMNSLVVIVISFTLLWITFE